MKRLRIWLPALVVLMLLATIALDQRLIIRYYEIEAEEVTSPVCLAVLTDLHECDYGPDGEALLAEVAANAPDAVLLVGDMFADGGDYAYGLSVMRAGGTLADLLRHRQP